MDSSDDRVLAALDELDVPYEVMEIDPRYADTAAFCEKYGIPVEVSANTIVVASKKEPKQYAACVALAYTRLDVNKKVRAVMGASRLSFASAEEMMTLTGMKVGGVTPFALPEELPLYVDSRIMDLEWVYLGGGGRNSKIKISPRVFTKLGAQVVKDLANPIADTPSKPSSAG